LSLDLNVDSVVDDVTSRGREFRVRDAAAGKARSPIEKHISTSLRPPASLTKLSLLLSLHAYLHSVLKQYAPSRRLHSSDCSLLAVPRVRPHASVLVVLL